MWNIGANLEHSAELEVGLVPGSVNHMIVGLQTEETPIALSLNGTKNAVIWGGLLAFWNASQVSPSPVVSTQATPVGS